MSQTQDRMQLLTEKIVDFRDKRDWKQFHAPKELAIALSIEASELLELFRFRKDHEIECQLQKPWPELADELADVFYFVLLMAHDCDIDLEAALLSKLAKSNQKYPVELCKGKNLKYTAYQEDTKA